MTDQSRGSSLHPIVDTFKRSPGLMRPFLVVIFGCLVVIGLVVAEWRFWIVELAGLVILTFAIALVPTSMIPVMTNGESSTSASGSEVEYARLEIECRKLENDIRGTLLQIIGSLALVGALVFGYLQLLDARTQTNNNIASQREQTYVTLEGQFAERFEHAISGLGGSATGTTEARIGAIEQLQNIATMPLDSADPRVIDLITRYEAPSTMAIAAAACSLSRSTPADRSNYMGIPDQIPPLAVRMPEIQAAMNALSDINEWRSRTHLKPLLLPLVSLDLMGASLPGAHLSGAVLTGANLEGANFKNADLGSADLRGADLRGADFTGANLQGASLDTAIGDEETQWGPSGAPENVVNASFTISAPVDGSAVTPTVKVEGSQPPGDTVNQYQIWVAVIPIISKDSRYYVTNGPAISENTQGTWRAAQSVYIGQSNESGKQFAIVAILADLNASKVFENYWKQGTQPGIARLPNGAFEVSRVLVMRA